MYGEAIGFQPKDCKSGHEFELWVQGVLTALGFDAKLTGGNDNGVDVITEFQLNELLRIERKYRYVGKIGYAWSE